MDELQNDAVTPEAGSSAPDVTPEPDSYDTGADSFDRAYVEKLRQESASYRTKAKEYEPYAQVFESYEEEDRAVWQEAMRRFKDDPKDGGEYLRQIADAVLAEYQEKQEELVTDDQDRPLTMAQYTALREAEREKAEKDAEVARIEKTAAGLGYDTTSEEYTYLLTVASRLPDGSIEKAHAKITAAEEARFEARLAKMQAEAEDSPTAPNAGSGAAPSTERSLKTWKDAERASKARLEAAQIKRS